MRDLLYSILALLGVLLIFSLDLRFRTGILLGVVSSALAALFMIYTKRVGQYYPAKTILLYEMIGGFFLISLVIPFYLHIFPVMDILPGKTDFLYLLVFAFFCTIILQLLQIQVLKELSAFTVTLSYNLEPVYSILLAMLLFGEARELNAVFYIGISFIVLSVVLQMRYIRKQNKASLITD